MLLDSTRQEYVYIYYMIYNHMGFINKCKLRFELNYLKKF